MKELQEVLIDIQDCLVPILDTYEQAIYHYIFRHTYLKGEKSTLFRAKSASIGFGSGAAGTTPSESQRSKKLRSLESKGGVKVLESSHKGIHVAIVLPHEIESLIKTEETQNIDIESLDFYKGRMLLSAILERENFRCFYTGKKITEDNCYLDHVVAQSAGGDNSYRNIVAASYDANSMKNNMPVDDFARSLYKKGLLSLEEFNALKQKVSDLQNGKIAPNLHTITNAISS